jgi:hypothetical protein
MNVPRVIDTIEPAIAGVSIITYSITWDGITALSSPTASVYKDGVDITDDVMPSGSNSVSGNVQTLKPIDFQSEHGGSKYVVVFGAVADGNTEAGKFVIPVERPADE